jgi:hypothetical protein
MRAQRIDIERLTIGDVTMRVQKVVLAAVFSDIAERTSVTDDVAGSILTAIKQAKADTLEKFTVLVEEAYTANGWNRRIGRLAADAETVPAPHAVKVYVSTIRGAYKLGLTVTDFEGIRQLRDAVKAARSAVSGVASRQEPQIVGVHVNAESKLTGATWHDAIVVWKRLPKTKRAEFAQAVERLAKRYGGSVVTKLKRAA